MPTARRAALGLSVHTGRAIVVAVGGSVDAPEVLEKTQIHVATTFDEGAVFHVGQELPIAQARTLIEGAELRFTQLARAELEAFVTNLGARVVAAGLAAPDAKTLPPLEKLLKSHALVHTAEGELYRRVFAAAAASLGSEPIRVPADALAQRIGKALQLTPAKVGSHLNAMGKASGKPWAADQKQAALVAWLGLALAA